MLKHALTKEYYTVDFCLFVLLLAEYACNVINRINFKVIKIIRCDNLMLCIFFGYTVNFVKHALYIRHMTNS